MTGGYLTLDLREIKNTGYEYRIIKKGIYKYILNTNKPIEIILSRDFINKVNSSVGTLCNTFRVNSTKLLAESEFGLVSGSVLRLPIIYNENYNQANDIESISYGYYKCEITPNDEIYISVI